MESPSRFGPEETVIFMLCPTYVKYSLTTDILKLIYFASVLSIMAYGINRIRF